MTLGSILVGVVMGYGLHKVAGVQLDKGIDPALLAIKEQIIAGIKSAQVKMVAEKIEAAEPVECNVIEMS